jgi:hypothetical protein
MTVPCPADWTCTPDPSHSLVLFAALGVAAAVLVAITVLALAVVGLNSLLKRDK